MKTSECGTAVIGAERQNSCVLLLCRLGGTGVEQQPEHEDMALRVAWLGPNLVGCGPEGARSVLPFIGAALQHCKVQHSHAQLVLRVSHHCLSIAMAIPLGQRSSDQLFLMIESVLNGPNYGRSALHQEGFPGDQSHLTSDYSARIPTIGTSGAAPASKKYLEGLILRLQCQQ